MFYIKTIREFRISSQYKEGPYYARMNKKKGIFGDTYVLLILSNNFHDLRANARFLMESSALEI